MPVGRRENDLGTSTSYVVGPQCRAIAGNGTAADKLRDHRGCLRDLRVSGDGVDSCQSEGRWLRPEGLQAWTAGALAGASHKRFRGPRRCSPRARRPPEGPSPLPTEPAPGRLLGCPPGEMHGDYDAVQPSEEDRLAVSKHPVMTLLCNQCCWVCDACSAAQTHGRQDGACFGKRGTS